MPVKKLSQLLAAAGLLLVSLFIGVLFQGGPVRNGFQLALATRASEVTVGDPIIVTGSFRNFNLFDYHYFSFAATWEQTLGIRVYDSRENRMPRTWDGDQFYSGTIDLGMHDIPVMPRISSHSFSLPVNQLYDMRRPDVYSITIPKRVPRRHNNSDGT